jgi:hypothetical protein
MDQNQGIVEKGQKNGLIQLKNQIGPNMIWYMSGPTIHVSQ